jgi:hypothetical protein
LVPKKLDLLRNQLDFTDQHAPNIGIQQSQAFYSQASYGRLEMKSHKQKTGTKQERKKRKTNDDKKLN